MLVKQQIASLAQQARKIDSEVDEYAAQRDVLARERDALKAALANVAGKGSYAVLPYKGDNGTWRRPIVLECTNGAVTLRPNGPTFSMLDLSGLVNPRSSPIIVAIARELLKVQGTDSPDGWPVVPYFVFLVRPDGVRPYYEARPARKPGNRLRLRTDRPEPSGRRSQLRRPRHLGRLDAHRRTRSNLAANGLPGTGGAGGGFSADRASDGLEAGGGLAWPGSSRNAKTRNNGSGSGLGSDLGAIAGAFDSAGGIRGKRSNGGAGDSPDDFVWSSDPQGRGGDEGKSQAGGGDGGEGLGSGGGRFPNANAADLGTAAGRALGVGIGTRCVP